MLVIVVSSTAARAKSSEHSDRTTNISFKLCLLSGTAVWYKLGVFFTVKKMMVVRATFHLLHKYSLSLCPPFFLAAAQNWK